MACYWGCGTSMNKIVWALFTLLMCAGIAMVIGGSVAGTVNTQCFQKYASCYEFWGDMKFCRDATQKLCDLRLYVGLIACGIAAFVTAALITSWFCCCSQSPKPLPGAVGPAPGLWGAPQPQPAYQPTYQPAYQPAYQQPYQQPYQAPYQQPYPQAHPAAGVPVANQPPMTTAVVGGQQP